MNKTLCNLLIVISLIGFSCGYDDRNSSLMGSDKNTSPSESVALYLKSSLIQDDVAINSLTTKTPSSYWRQCNNPNQADLQPSFNESDEITEKQWADGYFDLLQSTATYIKTNNIKLISIYNEKVFNNEAVVWAETGNQFQTQNMTFYLYLEENKWKVFLIDSDNSIQPNQFIFAEERPVCG